MSEKEYCWMFVETDGRDEQGIVGAVIPGYGNMPLVTTQEKLLKTMRPIAKAHAKRSGHPVHLVQFTERTLLEKIT